MLFDLPFDYVLCLAGWLIALAVALVALLWLGTIARRRGSRWRLAINAGLSLWFFLAALSAVEVYFAFVYDQSDSFNVTNVSKHWFARHIERKKRMLRFKNGYVTYYRDDHDVPASLPEGKRHVCFVGDSFTFGHGVPRVEDRFSNRVGRALDEKRPGRFVVSNLAWAGTDLNWIEILTKEVISDGYPLDVLVYVVCLNDIEPYIPDRDRLYEKLRSGSPQSFLILHTYFPNLLYFRIQAAAIPEVRGYYSFLTDAYATSAWEEMRGKLASLHELCRENSVELRLVIFPFLHNLGPDYPFAQTHAKIAEYAREAGIPLLDLEPVLAPHVGDGLTVNRFDAHPNERAHELAAEAIERDLFADLVRSQPESTGSRSGQHVE